MIQVDGVKLGRWTTDELTERLERAGRAELNFDSPGSTLGLAPPTPRPGDFDLAIEVPGTVAAAAAALRGWRAHEGIRARVVPEGAALVAGTSLLVVAPFGPVEMAVPNRILHVVDEPDRFGFVYGSLAGHAEAGEELFLAEAIGDGQLRLSVTVHAGPSSLAARLVGMFVVLLSKEAGARYLRAWRDAIADEAAADEAIG
jgi:uncharacterized protein (UPF0548 family)